MNKIGHLDAISVGHFPIKIWERIGVRRAVSLAQLRPINLALETIQQQRKAGQHRIGSKADSPSTERHAGAQ